MIRAPIPSFTNSLLWSQSIGRGRIGFKWKAPSRTAYCRHVNFNRSSTPTPSNPKRMISTGTFKSLNSSRNSTTGSKTSNVASSSSSFWDKMSSTYNQTIFNQMTTQYASSLIDLAAFGGGTVLDLGVGNGALATAIIESNIPFTQYIGGDYSQGMVDNFKQLISNKCRESPPMSPWHRVKTQVMDAHRLPLETNSVDTIVCAFALEFFQSRPLALREMFRVLRPGGKLVISYWASPEENSMFHLFYQAIDAYKNLPSGESMGKHPNFSLAGRNVSSELEMAGFRSVSSSRQTIHGFNGSIDEYINSLVTSTMIAQDRDRATFRGVLTDLATSCDVSALNATAVFHAATKPDPSVLISAPGVSVSDELTKLRHFFYHVDSSGRIWRQELDKPGKLFGEVKQELFRDEFFLNLQLNDTGLYPQYPYVSRKGRESYFMSYTSFPIVFHNMIDGELCFGSNLRIPFLPARLCASSIEGPLYYTLELPVTATIAPGAIARAAPEHRHADEIITINAGFEKGLMYNLMSDMNMMNNQLVLDWEGSLNYVKQIPLPSQHRINEYDQDLDPSYVERKTRFWKLDE